MSSGGSTATLLRVAGAAALGLLLAIPAGISLYYYNRGEWSITSTLSKYSNKGDGKEDENGEEEDEGYVPVSTYESLIGNTPLVELRAASALTGCRILVKMESLNPGGTGKDRAARAMLREALEAGRRRSGGSPSSRGGVSSVDSPGLGSRSAPAVIQPLRRGGHVVEGTSGSTGISLACLCSALGLRLHIVMPDDQSQEKRDLLQRLGAELHIVPACAISNANHYVNSARKLAASLGGFFVNQFENRKNGEVHFATTGPEIYEQARGLICSRKGGSTTGDEKCIDAFVMSSGTGGTIAGVSRYLKSRDASIRVVLADPVGSSLYNKVKHGVCYAPQQAERTIKRHRYDSIVEGVGLDRLTANFELAQIDDAMRITDQEIVDTAHWLLRHEGLFVGSSSALNVAAACRLAVRMRSERSDASSRPPVIVTVICDSGQRHVSRLWNPDFVRNSCYNLYWPGDAAHGDNKNSNDEDLPPWLRNYDSPVPATK